MAAQKKQDELVLMVGDRRIIVRTIAPDALRPNPDNANLGRERGNAAIDASLGETGLHRGIVVAADGDVIAGNHVYEAAVRNGVAQAWIEVEMPDGAIGVVTKRSDWRSARDPNAIKAALNDNRTQFLNYEQDVQQLLRDVEALQAVGEKFAPQILTEDELREMIEQAADEMLEEQGGNDSGMEPIRCPHCGHEFTLGG